MNIIENRTNELQLGRHSGHAKCEPEPMQNAGSSLHSQVIGSGCRAAKAASTTHRGNDEISFGIVKYFYDLQ